MKNPVILRNHNAKTLPVGRVEKIEDGVATCRCLSPRRYRELMELGISPADLDVAIDSEGSLSEFSLVGGLQWIIYE